MAVGIISAAQIPNTGTSYAFPLTNDEAPGVFFSVFLQN